MRIPKLVSICGQQFTVTYKKNLVVDGDKLLGCCDVNECKIILKQGMSEEKKKEVFFHECVHAIEENLNMNLGENKVNLLGIHILSLITNNNLDFRNKKKK